MVKGLQFWAASYCRSMLSFYEGIGLAYGVPLRICVGTSENTNRADLGWDDEEFSHLDIVAIGSSLEEATSRLKERQDWHQVFGAYQANTLFQQVILHACRKSIPVGICSEAPLNMTQPGVRRRLKSFYLKYAVPKKVKVYVSAADFVINLSGSECLPFLQLGWPPEKIIPCGYFPPALSGSTFRERAGPKNGTFHILCTGSMTWHRGQDVLVDSLKLLKNWAVPIRATFTQSGPLEGHLRQMVHNSNLPVHFVGKVPMSELIKLLEECSCYVATGREEPWGIRVNDALHCGAPLVVSRGMGASKIIDDYGCGITFNAGDAVDLAWKLRQLILDHNLYTSLSQRVAEASKFCRPHAVAAGIVEHLRANFEAWK